MEKSQEAKLKMLGRVVVFGKTHPEDFPAGSRAAQLMGEIGLAEARAIAAGTGQLSNAAERASKTVTKDELYDDLYEDLQAINRAARAAAPEVSGLEEKFRMPRTPSFTAMLASARAFLSDAPGFAAIFIEYGLPADFLEDLEEDIAAFEEAEDGQGEGLTEQVGSTRGIVEALAAGMRTKHRLDAMLKIKYRYHPERLSEWISASHVERAERKAKAAEKTPGS